MDEMSKDQVILGSHIVFSFVLQFYFSPRHYQIYDNYYLVTFRVFKKLKVMHSQKFKYNLYGPCLARPNTLPSMYIVSDIFMKSLSQFGNEHLVL